MNKVKTFFILLFMASTIVIGYMFFLADLSVQKIAPKILSNTKYHAPTYLISYADGDEVFFQNQHALTYSGQNKGFDIYCNFRKNILDKDFTEKYQNILKIKAGAGLWLWKPQIILQTMKMAPKNSVIIYTDVGFVYVRKIDELLELANSADVLLMNIDEYHTKEKLVKWLPKKIAQEWNILDLKSNQPKFIESGLIVVKNNENAEKFIKKWLEICADEKYAFLKYDIQADNIKGFTYDQSLLSLVAYHNPHGIKIIPKEMFKKYTLFHHRHPGNHKPLLPLQVLPAKQIREWIGNTFPSFFLYFGF